MAHEVEQMMYVGETPWHGLGIPLDNPPTVEEAIRCAGLNWSVRTDPVYRNKTEGLTNANYETVSAQVVVREDTNAVLGVVGPSYTPLQNRDALEWFQPFLDEGLATLNTAGSLRGGERVWALAELCLDPSEILPNDLVRKYLLLSNGHDGKLAVRVGFTPIRVVCSNTMAFAHDDVRSALIRVRHTARVKETVDDLRDAMNMVNQSFEATAEQYRYLASRDISQADLEKYVKVLFKIKPNRSDDLEAKKVNVKDDEMKRTMNKIVPLFESGRGTEIKGVRGTWWGAYNAVSEYLTWERGRDTDTRMNHLWYGSGKRINDNALKTAMQMAA